MLQPILTQQCLQFDNHLDLQHISLTNQQLIDITTHRDSISTIGSVAFQSLVAEQYRDYSGIHHNTTRNRTNRAETRPSVPITQYHCNISHIEHYMESLLRDSIVSWTHEAQLTCNSQHPHPVKFDATLSLLLQVCIYEHDVCICLSN